MHPSDRDQTQATPDVVGMVVALIEDMRENCYIAKSRHFSAAERHCRFNSCLGTPVVLINVMLGSVFFMHLSADKIDEMQWIGALLTLVAALLAALQTCFNFDKSGQQHRKIANRYLTIEREWERLQACYFDGAANVQQLHDQYTNILLNYTQVNTDAESCATSARDFRSAIRRKKEFETKKINTLRSLIASSARLSGGSKGLQLQAINQRA